MKSIKYEGYLTKEKLGIALSTIFGPVVIDEGSSFYIDLPTEKFIVVFHGPEHYTQSSVQVYDYKLGLSCYQRGITLVEIPYWVQFNDAIFHWAFEDEHYDTYFHDRVLIEEDEPGENVPHIFTLPDTVLPCDYNLVGLEKFFDVYSSFALMDCWSVMQPVYEALAERLNHGDLRLSLFMKRWQKGYTTVI